MRGEYIRVGDDKVEKAELPPRARRILFSAASSFFVLGTTSACAENTILFNRHTLRFWNYLRVRGEYRIKAERERKIAELPPRARRILAEAIIGV